MQCCWKNYIMGYYIKYMSDISKITDLLVCYCNLISLMRLMRQYLQEIKYKVYGTVVSLRDRCYHYFYYYYIGQRRLWERALYILLDNDAYESVRYTAEAEVLCCYNDYPFYNTALLISSMCLGITFYIELNDLKLTQLLGTSWLILYSRLILER